MTRRAAGSTGAMMLLSLLTPGIADAQLAPVCVENSPERRGEVGCSVIESKLLPDTLEEPLFWHIDRFASLELARTALGVASIALEAGGTAWLLSIEPQASDHRGGQHVALVGPLPLPQAPRLSMQVISARFTPGMYSLVHHHSGVEAFYVIEGEQCLETPTTATKLRAGETLAIPAGVPMRLIATGSTTRHGLAVIVHDATQPPTMRMEEGAGPQLATCE